MGPDPGGIPIPRHPEAAGIIRAYNLTCGPGELAARGSFLWRRALRWKKAEGSPRRKSHPTNSLFGDWSPTPDFPTTDCDQTN